MKSILLSVRPKWVEKILNGEKTIEVRKTAPKCDLPIEVYIYCTEPHAKEVLSLFVAEVRPYFDGRAAEFIERKHVDKPNMRWSICNGKVVAKFTLRKVEEIVSCIIKEWGDDPWETRMSLRLKDTDDDGFDDHLISKSGFDGAYGELHKYLRFPFSSRKGAGVPSDFKEGIVYGYAWHISDLVIFDKPKKLEEFYGMPKKINGLYGAEMVNISLSKAPQSWCYVEAGE